jgi:nitrogen fixation protein NifB
MNNNAGRVAVASYEGVLVNQHLGMAGHLLIYQLDAGGYSLLEKRPVPPPGGGEERWCALGDILQDCNTLLVSGVGETPCRVLNERGITVYEIEGLIDDALEALRCGEKLRLPRRSSGGCRRAAAGMGDGQGCG